MSYLSDYQPVEDRLREFHERFPSGRVVTYLIDNGATMPGEAIIFRAELFRGDELRDTPCAATGYAHQRILKDPPPRRDGQPNYSAPEWTSPWEVAETSAVGRALANMGFAPKGARPSFEEVRKADVAASVSPSKRREPAPSDNPAVSDTNALAALLEAVGGSEVKAINAVNRAGHTSHKKDMLEHLDPSEWEAGLALVRAT